MNSDIWFWIICDIMFCSSSIMFNFGNIYASPNESLPRYLRFLTRKYGVGMMLLIIMWSCNFAKYIIILNDFRRNCTSVNLGISQKCNVSCTPKYPPPVGLMSYILVLSTFVSVCCHWWILLLHVKLFVRVFFLLLLFICHFSCWHLLMNKRWEVKCLVQEYNKFIAELTGTHNIIRDLPPATAFYKSIISSIYFTIVWFTILLSTISRTRMPSQTTFNWNVST